MNLCFVLGLLISLLCLFLSVEGLAYDVAKLKTKMNKMKATLTRHNTKEQSIVKAQALLPKFVDKAKNAIGRLHEEEYTIGFATFELLVRRTQTGPWYRYQDLLGTETTNEYVENVILGGLEAESWRQKLDYWISLQVFGKGTGSESIKKVKETLIQFKKMKPREFEFGYRIAVDGETVYSVEKSMKEEVFIKKSMSPSMARVDVCGIITSVQEVSQSSAGNAEQPLLISLKPILTELSSDIDVIATEDSSPIQSSISVLNQVVLKFYDRMVSENADGCLFFSDGSATPSEDGLGCASACCGVFLLPTKNSIPIYGISESIRIDSAGGMIDSPFDAELIAGLSAVTLASLIAKIITQRNSEVANGDEASEIGDIDAEISAVGADSNENDSPVENSSSIVEKARKIRNKIEFTLHTDSKTLCRAIRTGPKGDLAERASPSRLALWKLLSGHMDELLSIGLPVTVEWIPGHPERRDTDRNRWTVRDIGIWMADEIAKIEGNEVTAGFINNKSSDVDSNNNKLQVRSAEKVAKFVKKVALKSPKKTGVKKRNYYNTKLTFSKDPKNPNVLAAAAATAAIGAEEGAINTAESIVDGVEYDDVTVDNEMNAVEEGSADDARTESDSYEHEDTDTMTEEASEESEGEIMEDVDVIDIVSSEVVPQGVDEAPSMVPVSVITAINLIKFSTQLCL